MIKQQEITIWGDMININETQTIIERKLREIKDRLGVNSSVASIDHSLTQESGNRFYLLLIIVYNVWR